MALPPKPYFFLPEVAERWGATTVDLAVYAHQGLLELCVMVVGKFVEAGTYDFGERLPVRRDFRTGPQPLLTADIWPLVQNRSGTVLQFRPPADMDYARLAADEEPIRVTLQQLLVTREERDRFESVHQLKPMELEARFREDAFTFSSDFSEVHLLGKRYVLGEKQAAVIRLLYEASLAGEPWVRHDGVLHASGCGSARLVDLFKHQPDWRELIELDGRGSCRLRLPDRTPSKSRQRAFRRAMMNRIAHLPA